MKKKKVEYLCYESRFWYVRSLDFADFKYVIIYPLASFIPGSMALQYGHFRPDLEECVFITKIGMDTIITYLKSAKFEVFMYQK